MEKEKQLEENKQGKWIKGLAWNKSKMEMLLGIIVIIAILILLFSSSFTGSSADSSTLSSSYNYQSETQRLEEILKQIRGVGEVKVMITIRDSGEQVVEKDVPSESGWVSETDSAGGTRESESARQEESTVYITDSEGNRTPYISQTTQPEIEGVTVVAQGGGDALIQKNINEVIQALFDIEAHKIKVVKMK